MTGAVLFLFVMVVAFVPACAAAEPTSEQRPDASEGVVAALCDARAQVGEGTAAVESIFLDRAHDPLHDLARDSAEIDRAVAARLLEAKQALEAALDKARSQDALAADLDALIAATRRAVEATSGSAAGCPRGVGDE